MIRYSLSRKLGQLAAESLFARHAILASLILILIPAFFSCQQNTLIDQYERIPDAVWQKDQKVKIDVQFTEVRALYDIYFQIRNTTDYPYSNLYLFITTTLPDATKTRDTVECYLASPEGKWTGNGFGKIKESRWLMKKGMLVKKAGLYQFEIEQAMRVDALEGIADVGLRIDKQ